MSFIQRATARAAVTVRLPEGNYEARATVGELAPREPAVEITLEDGHEIPVGPAAKQRIRSMVVLRETIHEAMAELIRKVREERHKNGFAPANALS